MQKNGKISSNAYFSFKKYYVMRFFDRMLSELFEMNQMKYWQRIIFSSLQHGRQKKNNVEYIKRKLYIKFCISSPIKYMAIA